LAIIGVLFLRRERDAVCRGSIADIFGPEPDKFVYPSRRATLTRRRTMDNLRSREVF
jgi:hypothetical protein